jgi:hypothetical protein
MFFFLNFNGYGVICFTILILNNFTLLILSAMKYTDTITNCSDVCCSHASIIPFIMFLKAIPVNSV